MGLRAPSAAQLSAPRARKNFPDLPDYLQGFPFAYSEAALEFPAAYRLVSTVNACVSLIQDTIAELPVKFYVGEGKQRRELERKATNIVDVWRRPNPMMTEAQLVSEYHGSQEINGNAYLWLERFGTKKVVEIWSLKGHLVRPVPGPNRTIASYQFFAGGKRVDLLPEDVIHVPFYNSEDQPVGLSKLESVRPLYEGRYNAALLLRKFYNNGAMPNGFFSIDKDASPMKDQEYKGLIAKMRRRYSGADKYGDPVILQNMKFERAALTMQEMQFLETVRMTDEDICRAFKIPGEMLGFVRESKSGMQGTGTNAAERAFWQNCIKPRLKLRDGVLTEKLGPMFETGITIETDLSGVLPLQEVLLDQAKTMTTLTGRPILTVNQALGIIGLPKSDDPTADELEPGQSKVTIAEDVQPGTAPDTGALEPAAPTKPKAGDPASKARMERMIEGDEKRERARKAAAADLKRYERRTRLRFVAYFDAQERKVVRALEQEHGRTKRAKRSIDLDRLTMPDPQDEEQLNEILAELVRDRGEEALADLVLEIEFNVRAARVRQYLQVKAARAVTLVNETTRERLRIALAEAAGLNEPLDKMVARVHDVFDGRRDNAETIARTETAAAYNFATVEAWSQSGVVTQMEWLSARDSAVRETHAEADGQVVDLDATFSVGDSQLAYPGDESGPPEEVINCRCTVEPVIDEARSRSKRWSRFFGQAPSRNGHGPSNRLKEFFEVTK